MKENAYAELLHELELKHRAVLVTKLDGKSKNVSKEIIWTDISAASYAGKSDNPALPEAERVLETGLPKLTKVHESETVLFEPFFPDTRLIILGGGHIAKPLSDFASKSGFSVTVMDDRPLFANQARFPEATVVCDSFENCAERLRINPFDYVVIVTRGHRHDGVCLRQLLEIQTAYTGMIGSRRRVRAMKEQLIGEGYKEEDFARVFSPIGLDIGAVTPGEIAVSILAEVIREKRLKEAGPDGRRRPSVQSECDYFVLERLAQADEGVRAVITVTETKGSVPRNAGAKMILWPDGRMLGSIGGGCSEAQVIREARQLMDTGGHRIMMIDLTGELGEEEGMACGGTMQVFIEAEGEK